MGVFELGKMTMRSLFKKAPTRRYPHEVREPYPRTRGSIDMIDIHKCIFCGACQRKCPADCIVVDRKESRWSYWPYKCIACDSCVRACPVKDLEMLQERAPVTADNPHVATKVYELTAEEKAEKARIAAEKKAKALAAAKAKKEREAAAKAAKAAQEAEAAGTAADGEPGGEQ